MPVSGRVSDLPTTSQSHNVVRINFGLDLPHSLQVTPVDPLHWSIIHRIVRIDGSGGNAILTVRYCDCGQVRGALSDRVVRKIVCRR